MRLESFDLKKTLLAGLAGLAGLAHASVASSGLIAPGAASQGAGGLAALASGGASLPALNPASLLLVAQPQLSAEGGWLFDGSEGLAGLHGAAPADATLVALSLRVERLWTPATGNSRQSYALGFAVPFEMAGQGGLGLGLRFLESNYADPGRSLGLDLGLLWSFDLPKESVLRAGFSILDLDTLQRHSSGLEEKLPQVLKFSLAWDSPLGIRLGMDHDFAQAQAAALRRYSFHLGAEAELAPWALLRLGYQSQTGLDAPDWLGGSRRYDAGLGLSHKDYALDYALSYGQDSAGLSHRLALSSRFGKPARAQQPLLIAHALSGDGMAYLQWEDAQGDSTNAYVIFMSYRADEHFRRLEQTGGGQKALELRGLKNGTSYFLKVAAMDAGGQPLSATFSAPVEVKPRTPAMDTALLLQQAREELEAGRSGSARSAVLRAQALDPGHADATLLLQRIDRILSEAKP